MARHEEACRAQPFGLEISSTFLTMLGPKAGEKWRRHHRVESDTVTDGAPMRVALKLDALAGAAVVLEEEGVEVDGVVAQRGGLLQQGPAHPIEEGTGGRRGDIRVAEPVDHEQDA